MIDYLNMQAVYDPIYLPGGFTQISGGTVSSSYINTTNATFAGQSGSNGNYLTVPGTASEISDFYVSFKNVKKYTGANTFLFRAETGCAATGINYRPKIYNFSTSS